MFIGRNSELKRLERMYASGKLEFATVYGRRRVGKTTLINKFISDKKYIFLACQKSSEEDNLIELSKQISIYIGYSVSFSSFATLVIVVLFTSLIDYRYMYPIIPLSIISIISFISIIYDIGGIKKFIKEFRGNR